MKNLSFWIGIVWFGTGVFFLILDMFFVGKFGWFVSLGWFGYPIDILAISGGIVTSGISYFSYDKRSIL